MTCENGLQIPFFKVFPAPAFSPHTRWAKKQKPKAGGEKKTKNIQLKPAKQNGRYKIADAQIVLRCGVHNLIPAILRASICLKLF